MFSPAHFVTIKLLLAASDFSTKSFRDAFFAHLVILTLIALGLSWSSKEVLVESGNSLRHTFKDAQTIGLPSFLLSAPSLGSNSLASAQSATPTPRKADITGTHPSDLSTTRCSDSSDDVATGDTGVCVRTAQPSPRSVQNLSNSVITYNSAEIQPCIQVVLVPAKPYDQSPLFQSRKRRTPIPLLRVLVLVAPCPCLAPRPWPPIISLRERYKGNALGFASSVRRLSQMRTSTPRHPPHRMSTPRGMWTLLPRPFAASLSPSRR